MTLAPKGKGERLSRTIALPLVIPHAGTYLHFHDHPGVFGRPERFQTGAKRRSPGPCCDEVTIPNFDNPLPGCIRMIMERKYAKPVMKPNDRPLTGCR